MKLNKPVKKLGKIPTFVSGLRQFFPYILKNKVEDIRMTKRKYQTIKRK